MNASKEYRRKPPATALDMSAKRSLNDNLMARDGSSLDDPFPAAFASRPVSPSGYGGEDRAGFGLWDLPSRDRANFALLVLLYFLQGVPLGLATGSVPFLLKNYYSYSEMAIFSLASYPYSLKLLWSPVVDAIWSRRLGRRKSWILPVQAVSGVVMLWLARHADLVTTTPANSSAVWHLTAWWFLLVFTCATQDIAVDGWALTLLSPANVSYASTAQTVGLTAGQFLSYTVFLALNTADFANRYLRSADASSPQGLISLAGYLSLWGWVYLVVTVGLAVFGAEEPADPGATYASLSATLSPITARGKLSPVAYHARNHQRRVSVQLGSDPNSSVGDVYRTMWGILQLDTVRAILAVHLVAKIGFQANDGVTNLKLLDRGLGRQNLALAVLADFPFEIAVGYYAGKWSQRYTAMRLWSWAFIARLAAALVAQMIVAAFPRSGQVGLSYLLLVIAGRIFSTFTSTVMFVAVSAFHVRVADPAIGGTYMTLLATACNLGGTFPRYFVLQLVEYFTRTACMRPPGEPALRPAVSCALPADKERCAAAGGACVNVRDGYYIVNVLCVLAGAALFVGFIRPRVIMLQGLPLRAWRLGAASR